MFLSNFQSGIEWVTTNPRDAAALSDRAVVGGYEGYDNSPLWVIRAQFEGDLIPGKLAIKHNAAYVPWYGKENPVANIQVSTDDLFQFMTPKIRGVQDSIFLLSHQNGTRN